MDTVGNIAEREERPPYVRFEQRPVEDKPKSKAEGRYVAKDVDFALITPPYSKDLIEVRVDRWLENEEANVKNGRIPPMWLERWKESYALWKKGCEIPLDGTPIKGWQMISPAQQEMILRTGIRTVEDLAGCNDEGKRRLGMGALELVQKARKWLDTAESTGKVAAMNAAHEKEIETLKKTITNLEENLKAVTAQLNAQSGANVNIAPREEATLEERYIAKFGKKPHHLMKPETILERLEE